ncbi:unnamed protein product, partial [Lymnaea stagnalis]
PAQQDNSALVKDIMQALAVAIATQSAGQQAPVYLPQQVMGSVGQEQQMQQIIYAISQGTEANQAPRIAQADTTQTVSGDSISTQLPPPLANVVTTEAEVNGG